MSDRGELYAVVQFSIYFQLLDIWYDWLRVRVRAALIGSGLGLGLGLGLVKFLSYAVCVYNFLEHVANDSRSIFTLSFLLCAFRFSFAVLGLGGNASCFPSRALALL